ncbi:MAG: GtrA family protein [Planctomycetota bacterium]|nr:GtrA family protein [Planctomycetota bacterium]
MDNVSAEETVNARYPVLNMIRSPKVTRRRVGRFIVQATISLGLTTAIPTVLVEVFGVPAAVAVLVSFLCVFFVNFAVCRWYVFDSTDIAISTQLLAFAASTAGFRGFEYLLFIALHLLLALPYLPVLVGVLVVSFIAKFLFYSTAVFK